MNGKSYAVHFFLKGEIPSEPSKYRASPSHIGSIHSFSTDYWTAGNRNGVDCQNCQSQQEKGVKAKAQIPITLELLFRAVSRDDLWSDLRNLESDHVQQYLEQHLKWVIVAVSPAIPRKVELRASLLTEFWDRCREMLSQRRISQVSRSWFTQARATTRRTRLNRPNFTAIGRCGVSHTARPAERGTRIMSCILMSFRARLGHPERRHSGSAEIHHTARGPERLRYLDFRETWLSTPGSEIALSAISTTINKVSINTGVLRIKVRSSAYEMTTNPVAVSLPRCIHRHVRYTGNWS